MSENDPVYRAAQKWVSAEVWEAEVREGIFGHIDAAREGFEEELAALRAENERLLEQAREDYRTINRLREARRVALEALNADDVSAAGDAWRAVSEKTLRIVRAALAADDPAL